MEKGTRRLAGVVDERTQSERESMAEKSILIVLPTYNERANLADLVKEIHRQVPRAEVLVVDDASPDGTGELAEELAARDSRVHVEHRAGKMGLGTAYLLGFQYALDRGYDLVFEMDADFSHDPVYLPRFLEAIEQADLVLGSRYTRGGGTENWALWRRLLSRGGGLYARTVLGVPYRDLTGGYKCFRREVLEALPLDEIRSEGYSFQIEVTFRVHQMGFRIVEVPIIFRERREGESKISKRIVVEAMGVVWRLRRQGPPRGASTG